jgi:type I restriction enzyme M protein
MDDITGRCAILFPHGVLFRDEEQSMREELIKHDYLDCVIGLGPNLFYNASMEACIIICQKNKPNDRKNKVLFIDAKNEVTRKNAESYLEPQHIKRITDAYHAYADIDGFSKVVDNGTIASNRSLISIQSYVIDANDKQAYDLGESLTEWESQSRKMHNQVNQFISTLE